MRAGKLPRTDRSFLLPTTVAILVLSLGCGGDPSTEAPGRIERPLITVCPRAETVPGIDVTKYQGTIDWSEVRSAGMLFSFIRVNGGSAAVDTMFSTNWSAARTAGVTRGPYFSFYPGRDALPQAEFFVDQLNLAGGLLADDLPPALVVEGTDGVSSAAVVSGIQEWLDYVQEALGRRPILFTGAQFWESNDLGGGLSSYPLWVANYVEGCPKIPGVWGNWAFWQHSGSGSCPGISGAVNLDAFNGTLAELTAFVSTSQVSSDGGLPDTDAGGAGLADAGEEPQDGGAGAVDAGLEQDAGSSLDGGGEETDGSRDAGPGPDDAGGTSTLEDEPADEGCGCGNAGQAEMAWLPLVLAFLWRGRR